MTYVDAVVNFVRQQGGDAEFGSAPLKPLALDVAEAFVAEQAAHGDAVSQAFGATPAEKKEIASALLLLEKSPAEAAAELNELLKIKAFISGNRLTIADVALAAHVTGHMKSLPDAQKAQLCNTTRWCSHVNFAANTGVVLEAPLHFSSKQLLQFSRAGADAGTNKKEKKGKKEKKEKRKQQEPEKQAAAEASTGVAALDIRVGKIVECQKHPDADSLYVEKIDLGESEPRTVVSGLVRFVPLEKMQNRMCVCLCNLKPANMRGIKSHAMVLCCQNSDHSEVDLLAPPEGAKAGDRVTMEGYEGEPLPQLPPKKKIFEGVQPDLAVGQDGVAAYKSVPLGVAGGVVRGTIVGGSIG